MTFTILYIYLILNLILNQTSFSYGSYKICLIFVKWYTICVDNIMEPNLRHWIIFLWPPGIISLSFSKYKPPINSPNMMFLEKRKMSYKLWLQLSSHVLCADNGSFKCCHFLNDSPSTTQIAVSMESYNIALWE